MKTILTYRETLDCRKPVTSSNWVWKIRDGLKSMLIENDNILFVEWVLEKPRKSTFETFLSTIDERTELVSVIQNLNDLYVTCMRQRKAWQELRTEEYEIDNPISNLTKWIDIHNDWQNESED